jgi:hypothetical protein
MSGLTNDERCREPECARPPGKAHGMCDAHYAARRRAGTLPKRPTESERFWSKVEKTETCWLWTASKDRAGYGWFGKDGTATKAHRWAYESLVGPIPEDLVIDHLCRVRNCVRPDHLEPVTVAENTRRGLTGINLMNQDTCRNGLHPWPASAKVSADGYRRCRECAVIRHERSKSHA